MLGDAKTCHVALSTMGPSAGGQAATLAQATNHLCLQGNREQWRRLQPWLWIEEMEVLGSTGCSHYIARMLGSVAGWGWRGLAGCWAGLLGPPACRLTSPNLRVIIQVALLTSIVKT